MVDCVERDSAEQGFLFELHLAIGGYAVYSTFSRWIGTADTGREMRAPGPVLRGRVAAGFQALGQQVTVVDSDATYHQWLRTGGWGFLAESFESSLESWLRPRECSVSGLGDFADVRLAAPGVLSRRVRRRFRDAVFRRDGYRCVDCGATAPLTVHHVYPYSRGGEGNVENLVTLCRPCNEAIKDAFLPNYYSIVNLPHSLDTGLLKGPITQLAVDVARMVTCNRMTALCRTH